MEGEANVPALNVLKTNGIKFPDQAGQLVNPSKNAELNKETSERCRELKSELEKARRIL